MCVHEYTYGQEKGIWPQTVVTGHCEQPHMGAWNDTLIVLWDSKCSKQLSHGSSFTILFKWKKILNQNYSFDYFM